MSLPLFYFLFMLVAAAHALPITPLPTVQTSPLVCAFVLLPIPALAAAKYAYLRYRKGQSIHEGVEKIAAGQVSVAGISCMLGTLLGRIHSGYLIGFLGSPDWETRIKCRIDKMERKMRQSPSDSKPSSAVLYSRILGNSSRTSSGNRTAANTSAHRSVSRSRSLSASYLELHSPDAPVDITSCAIVHPSSPACPLDVPLLSYPHPVHLHLRRTPMLSSPTLMQIMEPVLSSWYDETSSKSQNSGINQDKSTSSAADSSQVRSQNRSQSPTPPFETPPTSPNSETSPQTQQVMVSVFRKNVPLSTSSSLLVGDRSSLVLSVFEVPSTPVPAPVYTAQSRRKSCDALPEDWRNDGTEQKPSARLLQSPTHWSPYLPPNMHDIAAAANRAPFSTTTRPLNVALKPTTISPPLPTVVHPTSPLELLSGKPKRSRATPPQRRKSGSPTVGPSPLRNSLVAESSVSFPTVDSRPASDIYSETPTTARASWELDDLVRDGALDVDAVSAVLGLGLTMGLGSLSADDMPSIPDSASSDAMDLTASDSSGSAGLGMGWGRARDVGNIALQIRTPGAQLCAIPEEDDIVSIHARNRSVESTLDIDLRLLGAEQDRLLDTRGDSFLDSVASLSHVPSAPDIVEDNVWEDEQSWRDTVSFRDSIGLAC